MSKHKDQKTHVPRIRPANLFPSIIVATCVLIVASLTMSARALLKSSAHTEKPAPITADKIVTPSIQQSASTGDVVGVELINLRPEGFEPSEITRSKGPFILSVDNRTGLQDLSFSLSRVSGHKEREARLMKRRKWKEVFDLPPGRYVLAEANHAGWTCQITITSH